MAPNREQAILDTPSTPLTPATPPQPDHIEPDVVPPQCGHGRASCSDFQKQYDWGQRMRQERDDARVALAAVTAERNAAVAKLTPSIKKLVAEDGELTMVLNDPYKITAIIARSLRDLVEAEGGPNYAEMSFKEAGIFKPIIVAVAKSSEQTPHALRLAAEKAHELTKEDLREANAENEQLRKLVAAMRQSCLSWFDNPTGPWGYECVGCTTKFTKSAGPGQPPSETRAYAELVHDVDCVFHPTPRLPRSSDGDLP